MNFTESNPLTFGLELEFQIVNQASGMLSPSSLLLWEQIKQRPDIARFALEITRATIEINTSVHVRADDMVGETEALTRMLRETAAAAGLDIRGGGTQLSQFWNDRVMVPTDRARELEAKYGFLPKRFSTYGMHVHIGVPNGNSAIRLGNAMQALSPLFIALSAASPFLQMTDTGFCASRPLESLIYPHGGPMPKMKDWAEFEEVATEIFSLGLAQSLKDVYWDVRPKPEFGTVEIRVFDTPLSIHKAVAMAAFARGCAALVLDDRLTLPATPSTGTTDRVNRFLACRDGLDARLFNAFSNTWMPAREWLDSLFDALIQAQAFPEDIHHIQALRQQWVPRQDCEIMRETWKSVQEIAQGNDSPNPSLSEYSRRICQHLLKAAA